MRAAAGAEEPARVMATAPGRGAVPEGAACMCGEMIAAAVVAALGESPWLEALGDDMLENEMLEESFSQWFSFH